MLINENNQIFKNYAHPILKEDHEEGTPLGDYLADMSASEMLDTIKQSNPDLYFEVESIMNDIRRGQTETDYDEVDAGDIGADEEDQSRLGGVEREDNITF